MAGSGRCVSCGSLLSEGAQFCGQCGQAAAAPAPATGAVLAVESAGSRGAPAWLIPALIGALVVALIGIGALLVSGGGSEETPSSGPAQGPALSERQWRQKTNSVCRQAEKDLDEITSNIDPTTPRAELIASYAEQAGRRVKEMAASIDALAEPGALEQDVQTLVSALSQMADAIPTDPSEEEAGLKAAEKVGTIAERLGLEDC